MTSKQCSLAEIKDFCIYFFIFFIANVAQRAASGVSCGHRSSALHPVLTKYINGNCTLAEKPPAFLQFYSGRKLAVAPGNKTLYLYQSPRVEGSQPALQNS